jgi:fatty-acyl-CoA synthase
MGHLQLRGPWVTGGYLKERPEEIRASPPMAGCARAMWGGSTRYGFVEITDRAKDLIKSGGEWIS